MASKNEDFFKDVFESLEDDQTGGGRVLARQQRSERRGLGEGREGGTTTVAGT